MKTLKLHSQALFIFVLIFSLNLKGQNTGPISPEASAFEPIDANGMVNHLTGDLTYVLPLLEIPGPGGGYPIVLSYHGGVSEDQEASWTGLGWSVNPGAINRSVAGNADDSKGAMNMHLFQKDEDSETTHNTHLGFKIRKWNAGLNYSYGAQRSIGVNVSLFVDLNVNYGAGGKWSGGIGSGAMGYNIAHDVNSGYTQHTTSLGFDYSWDNQGGSDIGLGSKMVMLKTLATEGVSAISPSLVGLGNVAHHIVVPNNSDYTVYNNGEYNNFVLFGWGHSTTTWFLNIMDINYLYGSINSYAGSQKSYEEKGWGAQIEKYANDAIEIAYNADDFYDKSYIKQANLTLPAFDHYSVLAQGITGSMSPKYLKDVAVPGHSQVTEYHDNGKTKIEQTYAIWGPNMGRIPENYKIHYYMKNLNESYYRIYKNIIEYNNDGNPTDDDLSFQNNIVEYSNGSESNYHSLSNRLGSSKYIQYYTYSQVNNFIENGISAAIDDLLIAEECDYSLASTISLADEDPIVAFKITKSDGLTYHFSIPAYQYETHFNNQIADDETIDNWKIEHYAYTWHLTAITGPDYFDYNGDHIANEGDWGYWIKFSYFHLTNGYVWQYPFIPEEDEEYQHGRKDIYYLDRIETATHIALFEKDWRQDGYSKEIAEEAGSTTLISESITQRTIIDKVFDNDTKYKRYFTKWYRADKLKPLRLKEIHLFDKKTFRENMDLILTNDFSEYEAEYIYDDGCNDCGFKKNVLFTFNYFYEEYYRDVLQGYPVVIANGLEQFENYIEPKEVNGLYNLTFSGSISEAGKNLTQKTIKFIYDDEFPLSVADNSDYALKGKLTLSEVETRFKGTKYFPNYAFEYNRFAEGDFDAWGYDMSNPANNSLSSISTPIGSTISIEYERDSYSREAIREDLTYSSEVIMKDDITTDFNYETIDDDVYNTISYSTTFELKKIPDEVLETNTFTYSLSGYRTLESNGNDFGEAYFFKNDLDAFNVIIDNANKTAEVTWEETTVSLANLNQKLGNSITMLQLNLHTEADEIEGGNLRVSSISINDKYKTIYNYNIPGTDISSGVTSYSISKSPIHLPYKELLPAPGVMYEYLTITSVVNDKEFGSTQHQFEVMPALNLDYRNFNHRVVPDNFPENPILKISEEQRETLTYFPTENGTEYWTTRSVKIENNLAMLGRPVCEVSRNSLGDVLANVSYNYVAPEDLQQGIIQEQFYSPKYWTDFYTTGGGEYDVEKYLTFNNIITSTNQLESVVSSSNGITSIRRFNKYNFDTGEPLETENEIVGGSKHTTTVIPAYHVYPGMGLKSSVSSNLNMLSHKAATIVKKDDKVINSSIQTWKNWAAPFTNIWRPHKTFVWDAELSTDGTYGTSFDDYNTPEKLVDNWQNITDEWREEHDARWLKASEVTQYDNYSIPIESKDINNIYSSIKKDPYSLYIIATALNSNLVSFAATSFEDNTEIDNVINYGGGILDLGSSCTWLMSNEVPGYKAHGGDYFVKVSNTTESSTGPEYVFNDLSSVQKGKYIASVWAHKESGNARLSAKIDGTVYSISQYEAVGTYGDWLLLNLYFDIPEGVTEAKVYLISNSTTSYFDDFRVSPYDASITSYTYDNAGNLTAILNADNFITKYEYDNAGRLTATYVEKPTGIEKVSSHEYKYEGYSEAP
ncbi:MAG TPA: hypothetical protein DDX98_03470 [Bacteroidales bacterium]|nr:hypothetical protein [Bacteroidales bacterium]